MASLDYFLNIGINIIPTTSFDIGWVILSFFIVEVTLLGIGRIIFIKSIV